MGPVQSLPKVTYDGRVLHELKANVVQQRKEQDDRASDQAPWLVPGQVATWQPTHGLKTFHGLRQCSSEALS